MNIKIISVILFCCSFNTKTSFRPENEVILYAVPVYDLRQIPTSKQYLKEFYDVKVSLRGKETVEKFLREFEKRLYLECNECKNIQDVRIYVEVYKDRKLALQFAISAGGSCVSQSKKSYCLSRDFLIFFSGYFPQMEGEQYKLASFQ